MEANMPPRILSIAGSDSGGGAGIQADIKTISMMGGHAMTAITAITAQNSHGVDAAEIMPPDIVRAQIHSVLTDFGADAIKIGMLGSADNAHAVADILQQYPSMPIVFDPVMVATSGAILADDTTITAFERLMQLAAIVTPNLPELAALGGEERVLETAKAVLIKGGHGTDAMLTDRLISKGVCETIWQDSRIDTPHMHGTGCTLSSAIAMGLAAGQDLEQAIAQARQFVRLALHDAPDLVRDNGPMGHYAVRNDVLLPHSVLASGQGPMFNQATIDCADYAASLEFYQQLGLRLIVDSPPRYARFEAPNGTTLSLHSSDKPASAAALYFEFADMDAAVDRLVEKGWIFEGQAVDQRWKWREAWTRDPSGHRICIYHGGEDRRYPPWRI
jgi:hydroxymethylpyrimidine/phosphomethylpyrimidine kinase